LLAGIVHANLLDGDVANCSGRCIPGAGQAASHCFADRIGDRGGAPESDFGLGRMDINVHFFERNFDEQQRDWIDAVRQDRAIAFRKGAANQAIANKSAIHKQELAIARGAPLAGR
jgi:hypothetical protein